MGGLDDGYELACVAGSSLMLCIGHRDPANRVHLPGRA